MIDEENKTRVLQSLTSDQETLTPKVIIATSSLGCGVNAKNVKFVVHFGPAYDTVDYCEPMNNAMLFYIIFQTNLQKTWKVMERVTPV